MTETVPVRALSHLDLLTESVLRSELSIRGYSKPLVYLRYMNELLAG